MPLLPAYTREESGKRVSYPSSVTTRENNKNRIAYESNVETTIGRCCGCQGEDADELVQALYEGVGSNGDAAQRQGAAPERRRVYRTETLHRRGRVNYLILPKTALSCRKQPKAENALFRCRTFALAREREWRQGQSQGNQRQPDKQALQQHPEHSLEGSPPASAPLAYCLTKNKMRMKKIKWSTVRKVLQVIATIITTIAGTIAVQSCRG